ncbi:hypothetical protein SAMN05444678_10979 [Sphingomonas sp. YR710]|nr:hypothetical protein SAMN05444678_10979 [Sphingomonas sp. YR710]
MRALSAIVIPAQAGTHGEGTSNIRAVRRPWVPAFAGMTRGL